MFATTEHLNTVNASVFDTALRLTRISIDASERLFGLALDAGRTAASDAAKLATRYEGVKTLPDFVTSSSSLTESGVDKVVTLSRAVYDVNHAAQQQVAAVLESKFSELKNTVSTNLDQVLKSAPSGTDAFVAALKSTVVASTAALEKLTDVTKQAAHTAQANVQAAVDVVAHRAKSAKAK